ncbi:MAG: hypothetical protein ACE14V_12010, partial [bacterium]
MKKILILTTVFLTMSLLFFSVSSADNESLIDDNLLSAVNNHGDFNVSSDTNYWYWQVYGDGTGPGSLNWDATYGYIAIAQEPGQKGKLTQVFSVPSTGWYTAKARVWTDISDSSKQQKVYLYLQELNTDNSIIETGNQVIYDGSGYFGSAWNPIDMEISFYAQKTKLAVQFVAINQSNSGINGNLCADYIWVYPGAANATTLIPLYNASFDLGSTYWLLEPYGDASFPGIWTAAYSDLILSQDNGMKGKASQWFALENTGRIYASAMVYSDAPSMSESQKVYLYVFDHASNWGQIIDSGNAIFQPGKWTPGQWQKIQFMYNPVSLFNSVQLVGINPRNLWEALYFDNVVLKQEVTDSGTITAITHPSSGEDWARG